MYCANCGKNIGEQPNFCQFCGVRVTPVGAPLLPKRPFVRYRSNKKIGGVCAGVARYFDLDANLVRVLWLLCVLLGGTGLLAYVILWIFMPLVPESPTLPA